MLRVSELQESAEDEINGRIDTSDGAVEELAVMAADHEERILSLEEQVAALVAASESKTSKDSAETTENVSETAESDANVTDSTTDSTEV